MISYIASAAGAVDRHRGGEVLCMASPLEFRGMMRP